MKAKETDYNGYLFRSRLEARWAVFFDHMNIKYKYEPRTFDLEEYGWYVPDFWLQKPMDDDPEWGWFVEIKPKSATEVEFGKLMGACIQAHQNGLMIQGSPFRGQYKVDKIQVWHSEDDPYINYNWLPRFLCPQGEYAPAKRVRKALRHASTYKFE